MSLTADHQNHLEGLKSLLDHVIGENKEDQLPSSATSFLSASKFTKRNGRDVLLKSLVSTNSVESTSNSDPPVPSSDKSMATLMKMLSAASGGPESSVQSGQAPMPQNVGVIPKEVDLSDKKDIKTNYDYLVQLSSLSSLYTGIWNVSMLEKRGRTEPYNISIASEASQAFADLADSGFQAMTGPLAGFYNISNAVVNTYQKEMRKTEVHLEFLTNLFEPYKLIGDALTQLDGILTTFVKSLANVKIESEGESSTVNQTIRINQVVRTNVTGDSENPVWLYIPKTRIVYMKIDNSTWKKSIGKAMTDEGFIFKMQTTVVDGELNVEKYLSRKEKLDQIFQYVTNLNLQAFGEKINPPPVNSA